MVQLKRWLPHAVRRWGRSAYEFGRGEVLDALDRIRGEGTSLLTPPRRLWHLVTLSSYDFHQSGREFRDFLAAQGLSPADRVLDVGCGIGRLALALADYLGPDGAYDGFDIMPVAIRRCRRITARHPNFNFRLVDLKSDRYSLPAGRRRATSCSPIPTRASTSWC